MPSAFRRAFPTACFVWCLAWGIATAESEPEAKPQVAATPPPVAGMVDAEPGVVVELYTSQGCAACPPADNLLARIAGRDGIIALSLHVDYWDYIGWRDRFAQPAFSKRQRAYARAEGSRSLFTPQMIVAGRHRLEGQRGMELAELLQFEAERPAQVEIELHRNGAMLEIRASAEPPLSLPVIVDLVRYRPREKVRIGAGENAGRSVVYHNIVTVWETLGQWDGTGPVTFHVRVEGPDAVVVLMQEEGPGPIVAAVQAR